MRVTNTGSFSWLLAADELVLLLAILWFYASFSFPPDALSGTATIVTSRRPLSKSGSCVRACIRRLP